METLEKDNLTGENHTGKRPNSPLKYLTASSVIGDKVYNNLNEELGVIKDIMLDVHAGTIDYVVIQFGGFLGIGDKYFAVPFKALEVDRVRQAFVLGQDKEVLLKAPGFDKEHWPDTNSHEFHSSNAYWGSFMGPNTGGGY